MRTRGFAALAALSVALPLVLGGCTARQRTKIETSIATALVSEEDEEAIGDAIHAEIERQGGRFVRDPIVRTYVEGIVARLLPEVRRVKAVEDVHVHVLDDPDVVNAFATPGGHVFVHSGLLLAARDEAEVAGVLAHEIAHLAARHPARRMVWMYGASAVAGLALGKDPALLAQVAAELVGGGVLAANSRSAEREADDLALLYVHRAGWDPRGLVRFFVRLREGDGDVPAFLAWLSTHPTSTERIERLRSELRARGWEGGDENADGHAIVKERLRKSERPRRRPGA